MLKRMSLCVVLLVGLAVVGRWALPVMHAQSGKGQASSASLAPLEGAAAVQELKQKGQYDSLQAAMREARYTVRQAEHTPLGRAAWHAPNPAGGYDGYVTAEGVSIAVKDKGYVSLTLRGAGYGYPLIYVGGGQVSGDRQSLTIKRDGQWSGLQEWYVNGEGGLEQGFTLAEPPGGGGKRNRQKLRLAFELNEGWRAVANADGQSVTLLGTVAGEAVDYGKLVVWDAHGSPVQAALLVEEERVVIEVNDAEATYPLTIDPTFALQQQVTAADGAATDGFGESVAISGETAVIGAYSDDIGGNANQGSAYVFVRSGAMWSQQAKLTATNGAAGDGFGNSVAISAETVVIGAVWRDVGANTDQGAAYVFTRSGVTWTQQAQLNGAGGATNDEFGICVAISGNTVVVGAASNDVAANSGQGSAYVFTRSSSTWTQQVQLNSADGAEGDAFGTSVAISGNTVVVGARNDDVGANGTQGSAYVFTRSGTTWSQQAKLTALDGSANDVFGVSVGISGESVVVGAWFGDVGGAAYVFTRSGTTWSQQAKLTARDSALGNNFGFSVAISDETVVVGARSDAIGENLNQGSAYVFTRNGTTWSPNTKLTSAVGATNDYFGQSVAISGETIMVGAYFDTVGGNANQGSVYFFTLPGPPNIPQAQLTATGGATGDQFGFSVAILGDTAVFGANRDDVGANTDQGSAYVFTRSGIIWSQQALLTAADGSANDNFGSSVAISGDTIVVGAPIDKVGINFTQGSAYVFTRSGTTWSQQAQLTATGGAGGDRFGNSVAISGETVLISAVFDDVGANAEQGSAYVFTRSGTTWTQQAQLTATGGAASDQFGYSVAVSGNTALVGAWIDDVGANTDQGSAYVFTRSGTTWTQQAQLNGTGGAADDRFGVSVAIYDDTAVVGADGDDVGANLSQGSAYVFRRSGTVWAQQAQLNHTGGAANDQFGNSVAISGETVVVGASLDDVGANTDQGSAYVFTRSGTTWSQPTQLTSASGATGDLFGSSVAISDATILVGAYLDDVGANADQGSASVFVPCRYELTPASQTFSSAAGSGSFTISCAGSCNWTASALPPWITITSSTTGTGNGTITFNLTSNVFTSVTRSSSISVSGSNFVVTQSGNCSVLGFNLSGLPGGVIGTAYSADLTASGGTPLYEYQLNNGTTLPPGLSLNASSGIISGTPTAGSQGNYTFTVAAVDANGCTGTRTYTLNIATCSVSSLSPTSANVSGAGGSGTFTVTAPSCAWSTVAHAPWITVSSNPSGTGNATVTFSVSANPGPARTGLLTVNNRTFTINQAVGDPNGDADGDGIPNGVEYTEGTNPERKDNDIFANTAFGRRLFVMQQYRDFLGREGDPGGISNWVNALNANTLTRAQVIESFFNSAEFQNTGAPIVRLYFAYFLRIPDYAGLQNWTNAYRAGMPLDTISNAFAGSAEFIQTYGSLNNTQFVTLVYNNVLGRAPDPTGLANWVNALNNGMPRGTLMLGFSESQEYKNRSGNWVYVTMMYVGMLRRSPDQTGFDNWVAFLNQGNSGLALINGFIGAQEYRNRFLP